MLNRRYFYGPALHKADRAGRFPDYSDPQPVEESPPHSANLVSSHVKGFPGQHAPLLDFDFPCRLIPSRTEGHYHLYLDRAISWRKYKAFLKAAHKAGLLEKGYYAMSVKRGAGFLRVPKTPQAAPRPPKPKRPDLAPYPHEVEAEWQPF